MTFEINDRVKKTTGYSFPGVVRSVYVKDDGVVNVVVEHELSRGMVHIFSPSQLVKVDSTNEDPMVVAFKDLKEWYAARSASRALHRVVPQPKPEEFQKAAERLDAATKKLDEAASSLR